MNYPYNAGFQNPYLQTPYSTPYNAPQAQNYARYEIIKVNGKSGADALQMAPNSSVFVADETNANRIWLCMTDGAGYKTVRAIKAVFEDVEEKNAFTAFDERLKRLEDAYEQLNTRSAKPKQSNVKADAD